MEKLLNRFVFFFNGIAASLMIVSFVLPFLPPSKFPAISILSLGVPVLIVINLAFLVYWILRWNRRLFLSLIVLAFSYFYFNEFYEFGSEGIVENPKNSLSIMSYNVRLFNAFEEEDHGNVPKMMKTLFDNENPDVVVIQEYYRHNEVDFSRFPYQFIHFRRKDSKVGYAIFSKFPLLNTGAFDFKFSDNNALYTDIVKEKDTFRLYNMHLQSMGITAQMDYLQQTDKEKLLRRLSHRFRLQEIQMDEILAHRKQTHLPVILVGDMNNTAFSYTYRRLGMSFQDAFRKRGNGLGTTFYFDGFPMRIDYVFVSDFFDVQSFHTISETFSDHRAIRATLTW